MNNIINWGRVLANLSVLIDASEDPYFDLLAYSNHNDLNYTKLLNFMEVGQDILTGKLNLTSDIKNELSKQKRLVKQLEVMNGLS